MFPPEGSQPWEDAHHAGQIQKEGCAPEACVGEGCAPEKLDPFLIVEIILFPEICELERGTRSLLLDENRLFNAIDESEDEAPYERELGHEMDATRRVQPVVIVREVDRLATGLHVRARSFGDCGRCKVRQNNQYQ